MTGRLSKAVLLTRIYTTIAVSSTLLELYGITYTLHTLTWRFVLVVLFIICAVFNDFARKKIHISKKSIAFIPFFSCALISLFGNVLMGKVGFELRLLRFLILLAFSAFYAEEYFDGKYGLKVYRVITLTATVVMLTQVVAANFFGVAITGHLNLPLRSDIYRSANFLLRYYSIFEEPGYYGIYVAPYICIRLNDAKVNFIELGLIMAALLLSTSTSNIAVFVFVIILFVFTVKNGKMSHLRLFGIKATIIFIGGVVGYLFYKSPQFAFVLKRLNDGYSYESRAVGYKSLQNVLLGNAFNFLFGNSMEAYPVSGYATMIITFGLIGTAFYLLAIFYLFIKTNRIGKMMILSFMFINIGNVEFLGNASSMLIVYPYAIWYAQKSTTIPLKNLSS